MAEIQGISVLNQEVNEANAQMLTAAVVAAGVFGTWPRGQRDLTYAVDRSSFESEQQYRDVLEYLNRAADDWEAALAEKARKWNPPCPDCMIDFIHLDEFDDKPTQALLGVDLAVSIDKLATSISGGDQTRARDFRERLARKAKNVAKPLTFIVARVKDDQKYLAKAFIPNQTNLQLERYLYVDRDLFVTGTNRAGVFRHEFGHILGFLHEQIRGVGGCEREAGAWYPVTDYDPESVMHYYCGGAGTLSLRLSELDKAGLDRLYGPNPPTEAQIAEEMRGRIERAGAAAGSPKVQSLEARERSFLVYEGDQSSAALGFEVTPLEGELAPNPDNEIGPLLERAATAFNLGSSRDTLLSFKGESPDSNVLRIDGIDVRPLATLPAAGVPDAFTSIDARSLSNIREFHVAVTGLSASYGIDTGAYIDADSVKGEHNFQGTLYYRGGGDGLNARNFFDARGEPDVVTRLFGAALGGPLWGDHTFFVNYEGARATIISPIYELVPSSARRARATGNLFGAYFGAGALVVPGASTDSRFDLATASPKAAKRVDLGSARLDFALGKFDDDDEDLAARALMFRFERGQTRLRVPDGITGRLQRQYGFQPTGTVSLSLPFTKTLKADLKVGFVETAARMDVEAGPAFPSDLAGGALIISNSEEDARPTTVSVGGVPNLDSATLAVPGSLLQGDSTLGHGRRATGHEISFIEDVVWSGWTGHKIGFGLESRWSRYEFDLFGGAKYAFKNLRTLDRRAPATVTYATDLGAISPFGNGDAGRRRVTRGYAAAYAEDTLSLPGNAKLMFGLRWELSTAPHEAEGRALVVDPLTGETLPGGSQLFDSRSIFLPRFGFAWTPAYVQGSIESPTTVRLGFTSLAGRTDLEKLVGPIASDRITVEGNQPTLPADFGSLVSRYLVDRNKGLQPTVFARDFVDASRTYEFSAQVAHRLPGAFRAITLTVGYLGKIGRDLPLVGFANRVVGADDDGFELRQFDVVDTAGVSHPFKEFTFTSNGGRSQYNAFTVGVNREVTARVPLAVAATYTYSRNVTTAAAKSGGSLDFDYDRGLAAEDVPHVLKLIASWQMPERSFASPDPIKNLFLSSWSITPTLTAQSGTPVDVLIGRQALVYVDGMGGAFTTPAPGLTAVLNIPAGVSSAAFRPDLIPGVSPLLGNDRRYLNPAAFAIPAIGVLGNLPRGAIRGPNFVSVDLAISRTFRFQEPSRVWFVFKAEGTNLLNRANFKNPRAVLPSGLPKAQEIGMRPGEGFAPSTPNFGVISAAKDARSITLSFEINFATSPRTSK